MARDLEFGFGVFPYTRFANPRELLETVRLGEQLGFDAVGLPEHLLPPLWPSQPDLSAKYWYDLPSLMAWLASATTRLKLLTSVLVVPYHHPVGMAKAIATVDALSGGRVMLGIGTGWMAAEFRRLGLPFEERGAMTDDYLRAMIELWTSDAPAFHGRYVHLEDVSFFPKPAQRPHPPILVGGTGERPYRRVAELGQGWFPMTANLDTIREGIDRIQQLMSDRGRGPSGLWVGYSGIGFGGDERVAAMRHDAGDTLESEAPVRSAGEALERIGRYREAGVTYLSLGKPWNTAVELQEGLRWLAEEVVEPARRA